MLTFKDIEALLQRFTYKPNVHIEARCQNPWDDRTYNQYENEIMIRAVMWTLDSRKQYPPPGTLMHIASAMFGVFDGVIVTPATDDGLSTHAYDLTPVKVSQRAIVPEMVLEGGEKLFYTWLVRHVIGQLEYHETDEWAQVDGKPLHDPHESC
jgi:hypothetical protein